MLLARSCRGSCAYVIDHPALLLTQASFSTGQPEPPSSSLIVGYPPARRVVFDFFTGILFFERQQPTQVKKRSSTMLSFHSSCSARGEKNHDRLDFATCTPSTTPELWPNRAPHTTIPARDLRFFCCTQRITRLRLLCHCVVAGVSRSPFFLLIFFLFFETAPGLLHCPGS